MWVPTLKADIAHLVEVKARGQSERMAAKDQNSGLQIEGTGGHISSIFVAHRSPSGAIDPASQFVKPNELRFVKRGTNQTAVRRVHADDAHATAFGSDHPRLSQRFIVTSFSPRLSSRLSEICDHAADATPTRDCHAVPSTFSMMHEFVSDLLECCDGRVRVRQLRFLNQQHVRLRPIQSPHGLFQASLQRVDIPGGNPHAYRLSHLGRVFASWKITRVRRKPE